MAARLCGICFLLLITNHNFFVGLKSGLPFGTPMNTPLAGSCVTMPSAKRGGVS